MDQVVRRRYGSRKQMSNITFSNDRSFPSPSIGRRSSLQSNDSLVSPSRRRRQRTVGRKSLELGTERENGYMLRQRRSEDEEEEDDMDDDVDLEGRALQTKVNTWTSLETSATVSGKFKPPFSTLIWLAQVMTAFSLLGMVFMMLLAILVDAQPFYITGITTKEKHHRVSANAIHCSIAYGITAVISYYISLHPHRISLVITSSLRRFLLIFLLPFTTQYTPTYFYKRRIRRSYSALASTTSTPMATTATATTSTSAHPPFDHSSHTERFSWISSPWRMLRPKPMVYHHELPLYQINASSATTLPTTVNTAKASTSALSIPTSTSSFPPSSSRYYQNTDAAATSFWSTAAFRNITSSFNDGKAKKSKKKR